MTSRAIPLCPVSHPSGGSTGVGAVGLSRRQPRSAGDGPAAARRSTGLPPLRSALQLLTPARASAHVRKHGMRGVSGPGRGSGVAARSLPHPTGATGATGRRPPRPASLRGCPPALGGPRTPPRSASLSPSPPLPRGSSTAGARRRPLALEVGLAPTRVSPRHSPARSVSSSPSSGSSHSTATTRYKSLPADSPHPPAPRQVPVLQHPLPRATADNASPSPAHALPASRAVAPASHAAVPSSSHPTASRLHPH